MGVDIVTNWGEREGNGGGGGSVEDTVGERVLSRRTVGCVGIGLLSD
jgi:hypothetical protein